MLVYMPPAGWHHGSPRTSTGCVGATQVLGVMEPLVTKASAEIPVIRSTVRVCDADVVAAGSAQWTTAGSVASTIAPSSESVGSSPRPQDGVWLAGPPSGVRSASDERATGSSEHDHQGGSAEEDWRDGLDGDMAPGSEVQVGNRHFVLQKMIGQGAFGVVWTAFDKVYGADSCLVAMKIMNTSSQEDLDMAIFEAELLRRLRGQLSAISYNRVPQYIAHSTAPHPRGQAGGVVNLAMSFVPGVVLDQWLYGINDEEHKRIDVCQIVSGQLPGSRMHSMTLVGACAFAGELVSQLAGVFAALQPVAFHRDVSSHNVLVNFAESGGLQLTGRECTLRPDFALIDFGLAVRSDTWHHEWSESNLAGDPRYWMSPAWMAFAFGFDHVENHPNPSFHRQYLTRIDHYSLGILGLEVLFALWDVEHRFDEERAPGMIEARKVWCSFWEAMFSLFQMFHMQGPEETRQYLECSAQDGIAHLSDVLKQVQQALRAAEADPANAGRAPLLHVLADLVDEHGVLEWSDIPPMFGVRVEPEPSPTIVEFHHPLMEVHAEPMTGMWSTMQKCDVQQHQAEARRSVGGSGLRMPVQMPQSAAASGTAQASVDTSLCSSGGGLASSKLPEVTRYELLPSNGSCQPRCASLQLLAPFNVRPSRSTSQERGVRLYSQSMSRARSLSQERGCNAYPALPSPVIPAGTFTAPWSSSSSYSPPTTLSARTERQGSVVFSRSERQGSVVVPRTTRQGSIFEPRTRVRQSSVCAPRSERQGSVVVPRSERQGSVVVPRREGPTRSGSIVASSVASPAVCGGPPCVLSYIPPPKPPSYVPPVVASRAPMARATVQPLVSGQPRTSCGTSFGSYRRVA